MSCDAEEPSGPIQVRVGVDRRNFAYVDFTKHRLHEGKPEVIITGLGRAISDAVAVVEILKNQGLVTVKKITTSRGNVKSSSTSVIDKIEILVVKSKEFDSIYEEQQKRKDESAEKGQ
ncbi:hypothetical protein C3747_37g904c [Trypanosoma cruzi]|uniref:DNA/RNA-binding protein Alba-like domain-containing protein n=2 Tax=Trypanosoma cruzi TaxID=5693 RepID=Q4CW22_TRYCC|nr:hypothetical protein, conserved [Trypanosoma cruzi]XP_812661.1 hypothetical protein, conserved [Trypanosoma cruzi]EAN84475.1 hypothetical protein, conserved [Trypanosoma cruzi]EAN90810.1 hypothetical protein, conserved [Trypanosoma cruzi]KAF8294425.1 hypothetical protein TcYC6_0101540 [Trypanosoma cruzi]PWU94327.1 hypothetical protein C3747_280g199c [Trypanosoma cruzi]PWV14355.1 hypothetical protein C3747_37g904c [Trypanosoma cruzi]|eukprot:XP_806326.1 hypothetical protein [Trypanosoma cruzi strain CL Brener]